MKQMKSSDVPCKVMFQDRGLLEETVRLIAPGIVDAYDFASAVALDKEHLAATGRVRLQDKAYLVEPRDRRRPLLLVALEFQSDEDPDMAWRMEEYAHLAATGARQGVAAGRALEVLPVVVYNGERPWRASTEGVARRTGNEAPTPVPMYAVVDLPRLAEGSDEHGRRLWPGSRLATLAGLEAAVPERLPKLLAEAFRRHPGAESAALRRGLHLRVAAMLLRQGMDGELPPLEECERLLAEGGGEKMTTMMDAQFERWRDENVARGMARGRTQGKEQGLAQGKEQGLAQGMAQGRAQGMAQGRAQGMAQGRIALLERQAERRFGAGVAGRMAALLADVSDTSRLDEAGEWLVECDTGEALLERLPAIVRGTGNGAPG